MIRLYLRAYRAGKRHAMQLEAERAHFDAQLARRMATAEMELAKVAEHNATLKRQLAECKCPKPVTEKEIK